MTDIGDYLLWLARAAEYRSSGQLVEATLAFRRALRVHPEGLDALRGLAEASWAIDRRQDAIGTWIRATEASPRDGASWISLAEALLIVGDDAGALRAAEAALLAAPAHVGAEAVAALARLATAPTAANLRTLAAVVRKGGALDPRLPLGRVLAAASEDKVDALALADAVDALLPHLAQLPAAAIAWIAESGAADSRIESVAASLESRGFAPSEHDDLRRVARRCGRLGKPGPSAALYAEHCRRHFTPSVPLLWPRRTPGEMLRVALLLASDDDPRAQALQAHITAAAARFEVTAFCLKDTGGSGTRSLVLDLDDPFAAGRTIASFDPDVLVDLVGLEGPVGPLLAARPARAVWSLDSPSANVAPLSDRALPDAPHAVAQALLHATSNVASGELSARELAGHWADAVRAFNAGSVDAAAEHCRAILGDQPEFAPALAMTASLEERAPSGDPATWFAKAIAAAPRHLPWRIAAAHVASRDGRPTEARRILEEGIAHVADSAALWRELGLAHLESRDHGAARDAFVRAAALEPLHAPTHYNLGLATLREGAVADAARHFQRALFFDPALVDAEFNLAVILQKQGRKEAAVGAYRSILARAPDRADAYRNLGELLLELGEFDAWLENFRRLEAHCPDHLVTAVAALEAHQAMADFDGVDRYLRGLAEGRYRAETEVEEADCLEQLLYLPLFFDAPPELDLRHARRYDAILRRFYGSPEPMPPRREGRVRVGYLSADFRNHVMGKMMWQAISRHDRARFEVFLWSLSPERDEWTTRFVESAEHFADLSALDDDAAAARIREFDLDVLVDLCTHTKGARPAILARKPSRIQITHVASAGVLGLSAIDFKLTDRYADVAETARHQIEPFLTMEGCVYPYRHIVPAGAPPVERTATTSSRQGVVIGAFVTWLKLSRRCLALWAEVLRAIPGSRLAFSPVHVGARPIYERLAMRAGIEPGRLLFVPQGRDDGENQRRYDLVDFVLDPMPFGGVNGTLEALDMGVPVVTLVGTRHSERTSYSILMNLGVDATIAHSPRQYVEIARRLAEDAIFMQDTRRRIRERLRDSPLTDMDAHTRHLEQAYLDALEQKLGGSWR